MAEDGEPGGAGEAVFEALELFAGFADGLGEGLAAGEGGEEVSEEDLGYLVGDGFSHDDHLLEGQVAEGVDEAEAVAGVEDGQLEALLAGALEGVFEVGQGEAIGGVEAQDALAACAGAVSSEEENVAGVIPELIVEGLAAGFGEDGEVAVGKVLEDVAVYLDVEIVVAAEDGEDVDGVVVAGVGLVFCWGKIAILIVLGANGEFGAGIAFEDFPAMPGELPELGVVGLEDDADGIVGVEVFEELFAQGAKAFVGEPPVKAVVDLLGKGSEFLLKLFNADVGELILGGFYAAGAGDGDEVLAVAGLPLLVVFKNVLAGGEGGCGV